MIPVTESVPEDKQKVLIDMGNYVDPASYNAREQRFERYDNCAQGDRCLTYFYSGVLAWEPFPEPSGKKGFVNELEKPPVVSLSGSL